MTVPAGLQAAGAKEARARTLFRRQVAGLLILAAIVLAVCLFRADLHALFPPGWWRVW